MLKLANYDTNPGKIHKLFDIVAEDILLKADDFPIQYFRLVNFSKILSPDNETDYESRVEPSVSGGQKIGEALCEALVITDEQ